MSEIKNRYEKITAVVDCGNLRWEYRVAGAKKDGGQRHDEDVEHWDKRDIVDLTMTTLGVPADQRELIKVEYA